MSVRTITLATLAVATLLLHPRTASSQSAGREPQRWEFVVSSGRFMPVGDQRDRVESAPQSAATLTRLVSSSVAVTASVGWARSREVVTLDRQRLDVLTYDVGAEWRAAARPIVGPITLRPVAGAGLGLRSYDLRGSAPDATRGAAAYLAVGVEAGVRRVRLRVDVRDYVARARVVSGQAATRNDVSVQFGIRLEQR